MAQQATLTQVTTTDGLDLAARYWLPEGTAKTALAFVHGQSDHSARYGHVGQAVAQAGHAMFMVDLRGHGRSPGKRGHIERFSDYLLDLKALRGLVRQTLPAVPHFLGGHSMGGTVALFSLIDDPADWAGLVLSAPWLKLAFTPPRWKMAVSNVAKDMIPRFSTSSGLRPIDLSHDPDMVKAYRDDPHTHGKITARAYGEISAAQDAVLAQAKTITLPIVMLQGEADPVVSWLVNKRFFNDLASDDKTLHTYPELYHEVFNEADNQQVLDHMVTWLDQHT